MVTLMWNNNETHQWTGTFRRAGKRVEEGSDVGLQEDNRGQKAKENRTKRREKNSAPNNKHANTKETNFITPSSQSMLRNCQSFHKHHRNDVEREVGRHHSEEAETHWNLHRI